MQVLMQPQRVSPLCILWLQQVFYISLLILEDLKIFENCLVNSFSGAVEIAKLLIEKGVDVNSKFSRDGSTALHVAG